MDQLAHSDRKHSSIVGGSTAARRLNCTASLHLEMQVPKQPSSSYAEEGTACHEAIEALLASDEGTPDDLIGEVYNDHVMTRDLVNETIRPALRDFDSYIDTVEDADDSEFVFAQEVRVVWDRVDGAFGLADLIGRTDERSAVLDWKFGGGVAVSAENNAQGLFYAGCALTSMPEMFEEDPDWPIDIIIAQPRLDTFDVWRTTRQVVMEFMDKLYDAIQTAMDGGPGPNKGPWCNFARCKSICPLWTGNVLTTIEAYDEVKEITQTGELTMKELGEYYSDMLALAEWVEPLFKEIRKQAQQMLENGEAVPGHELVAKRASYKWRDEERAAKMLRNKGLKKADIMVEKMISPSAADTALKAADLVPLSDKIREAHVTNASTGHTMAKVGSGRKNVVPDRQKLEEIAARLKDRGMLPSQ